MAFLLDNILLAPITLPTWIGQRVGEAAYNTLSDDSALRQQLLQLQMRFELGEMEEEEYDRREADLLERIERARKVKKAGKPL